MEDIQIKHEGRWVRPLEEFEVILEMLHQSGVMVTCYCLTLNSKEPLLDEHVRSSLVHLLRKVPNLNVCIRPKDGQPWFQTLAHENVDFEILEDYDFQREYEAMTVRHYNSFDGPLWCAKLLPLPQDAPCAMPEIKLEFPYQYYLLFGFHHSITDGTSSIKICSIFLNLLNDVIEEKPIDSEHVAKFIDGTETKKIMMEVQQELMNNPAELAQYQSVLQGKLEDCIFLKAFPPPENAKPKTLNLAYALSKEETSKFLKRCKQEGVTIHSGFCAIVNTSIVQMLENAGIKQDKYIIKNYHTINNRRYWQGDTSRSFGAHLGKLTIISEINNNLDEFWNQAKHFHSDMTFLLKNKAPVKEAVAMLASIPKDVDFSEVMQHAPLGDNIYGTTNMGNLSTTFPGLGDFVQVTDFRRTTSTSKNLCSHVIQTFRGRFLYGIDYERQLMSTETAQLYVDTIFKTLNKVVEL